MAEKDNTDVRMVEDNVTEGSQNASLTAGQPAADNGPKEERTTAKAWLCIAVSSRMLSLDSPTMF